jgi:hypothetical protein
VSGTADATVRTFGTWLDDATVAAPGAVWVTASFMRWTSPSSHGVDVPAVAVAAGLRSRMQLSFAVPYSRASAGDASSSGIGDIYGGLKIQLVSPEGGRVGVSMSPTVEILNSAEPRQVHLVVPVSVEAGTGRTRVYGSAGWFTRGAVFASGAVERHVSDRVALTGALMQSWALSEPLQAAQSGLSRRRTDLSGVVSAFLSPSIAMFGGVARTVSPVEFDSATSVLFGGLAVQLTPAARVPVRVPR